ncbi:MAG TPA: hypothetical protein DD490_19725 [Acidobacteria bacterium]|nr:hypothetical protein [Acidobacteriota bacterium]
MGKLGQLLVSRGWITVQQLTRALQNQSVVGGRLGTCLIEIDALPEDTLLKGLSEQMGVPAAGIDDLRRITADVLALLPDKIARRCRAIPFRLEGSRLDLAVMDPRNLACQDEIAFATGKRVKIHVAHELRILEALERYYREESPSRFSLLVERLNRARFFWERKAETTESATTLAAPLQELAGRVRTPPRDLFASREVKIQLPPPLPEPPPVRPAPEARAPVAPAPVIAAPSPARVAPVAPVAPKASPAPPKAAAPVVEGPVVRTPPVTRPLTVPLTDEEKAALAPVGAAAAPLPPLATFEELEAAFEATWDRERVGRLLLAFLCRDHRRAALFQAGKDKVTAWMAQGELDLGRFELYAAGFDQPSVFLNLRQGTAFYVGALPPMPAHRQLAAAWGGELPRDCALLPIKVRDRMVAVVYADGPPKGLAGIDLQQLQRLTASAAAALQRCILHKKKGEAGA